MKPGRADKSSVKEPGQLAKEQTRKKASFDREQAIEETERVDKAKRAVRNAPAEAERLARDETRKKAFFANEQAIAKTQETRKLKARKQSPE